MKCTKKPKLKIEMQPFRIQINIKTSNKIYMPDGRILACKKIGLASLFVFKSF